jgi:hypothetical protein
MSIFGCRLVVVSMGVRDPCATKSVAPRVLGLARSGCRLLDRYGSQSIERIIHPFFGSWQQVAIAIEDH